ncbi:MAG: DegV family protein [Candidatus Bipolaricaulota bacterium]|nr:DegV family protein [Candidatus Bipolaricaulota bacterium]
MGKVKVITGSETGITPELAKRFNVELVPYYVSYNHRTYTEGVDFDKGDFYRSLRQAQSFPTTSHPTRSDIIAAFKKAGEETDSIIYVTISSKYSKPFELANKAKEEFSHLNIEVVDSGKATAGHGLVALEAARLAGEGADIAKILGRMEEIKERVDEVLALNTLKYLAKGGRIHRAKALVGSILSIKPLITYRDGFTAPIGKVRTHPRALEFIVSKIRAGLERYGSSGIRCIIEDADNREWANQVKERITKEFEPEEVWQVDMSPIAAVHLGPGAWGVAYYCASAH